jgi:hypothetical protein
MKNPFKTKSSGLLMLLAFVLIIPSACCFFKTPFDFNIGRFNEKGPQQPAVITISDPQVFARETLINDRLQEEQFLKSLLEESKDVKEFREKISTPALIRDIETLEAFRAAADVSFDPTKGAAALRQENQTTAPTDGLSTRITDLEKRLDTIAAGFGKRTVTVPIPDAERTRDAYRAELRQRLNAVNLDDLHDYNGNALFRLQFRATVMPGQYKDKFGIARLTFHPPLLLDEEIGELYRTWLNHLALRLNQPLPSVRKTCPEPVAALLRLEQAGLFEIYQMPVETLSGDPCTIYVPVPIGLPTEEKTRDSCFQQLIEWLGSTNKISDNEKARFVKNVIPILQVIRSANEENKNVKDAVENAINEIRKVGKTLPQKISTEATLVNAPDLFKKILVEDISQRKAEEPAAVSQGKKIVKQSQGSDDKSPIFHLYEHNPKLKFIARGDAYVYAASPLEKSQRLSTHAQTARSAELALSIAANLATKGISGKGYIGMIRQSAGIAEGFENQPIVVGFAERIPLREQEVRDVDPLNQNDYEAPQAGWVFGPEVRLDPEKSQLQLVQRFASHEVSVDLSVPGWWPYVLTKLETAWIGNLYNSGRPIRLKDEPGQGFHSEEFRIRLPLNMADLDGLTAIIALRTVGTYLPTIAIQHIDPFFISACSKQVDILIKGANVWRGPRVFLGGIEADSVAFLPYM